MTAISQVLYVIVFMNTCTKDNFSATVIDQFDFSSDLTLLVSRDKHLGAPRFLYSLIRYRK
jgi:hypothetical protein